MVGTRVDLQLGRQAPAEAVLRQHASHRVAHEADRMPGQHLARARPPHPARIGGVTDVLLLLELLARQPNLGRIDDDHEVAGVEVRGETRVGLPAQHQRDSRREAAEDLALGVGDVPAPRGTCRLGAEAPGGSGDRHRRSVAKQRRDPRTTVAAGVPPQVAGPARLQPATSSLTGKRSNPTNYYPPKPAAPPPGLPTPPPASCDGSRSPP